MMLIGLAGKAGSGKDTVAQHICGLIGADQIAFADPLHHFLDGVLEPGWRDRKEKPVSTRYAHHRPREAAIERFLRLTLGHGPVFQRSALRERFLLQCDTWFGHGDCAASPRAIMQWAGTAFGRNMVRQNIWIRIASGKIAASESDVVVLSDVRFADEAGFVRHVGGDLWHLYRGGLSLSRHESEAGVPVLDGEPIITNDGSLSALHERVEALLQDAMGSVPEVIQASPNASAKGIAPRVGWG